LLAQMRDISWDQGGILAQKLAHPPQGREAVALAGRGRSPRETSSATSARVAGVGRAKGLRRAVGEKGAFMRLAFEVCLS
jgi:hypothetical protein